MRRKLSIIERTLIGFCLTVAGVIAGLTLIGFIVKTAIIG